MSPRSAPSVAEYDPVAPPQADAPPRERVFNPDPLPVRQAELDPLIMGTEVFPALEECLLAARDTAFLAFRILDPETELRSPQARDKGLHDWGDLLVDTARRGVSVRLLVSDFDPVLANSLHRMTWSNARSLWHRADRAGLSDQDLAILPAVHEGEMGGLLRGLLWPLVRRRLIKMLSRSDAQTNAPGLSRHLREDGTVAWWPPAQLWPASHHEKFLAVDTRAAFIGGIDINERRYDDSRHDRHAELTWHDVCLRLHGPAAADLDDFFREFWNREAVRYSKQQTSRPEVPTAHALPTPPQLLPDISPNSDTIAPPSEGQASLAVLRTFSERRRRPWAISPKPRITEIAQAYHDAIGSAERVIYIENQYFRLRSVALTIAQRLQDRPDLQVIVLLPMAPDKVAFEGNDDIDARMGERLQVRALETLQRAAPDRVGLFSLVRDAPARDGEEDRAQAYGSGIVYLHAKQIIVDETRAILGSANINGRSFYMDTEVAVDWRDPATVAAYQRRLWQAHFGSETVPGGDDPLKHWRRIAQANAEAAPDQRQGHVVPYQMDRARKLARYERIVPNRFV
ncbi:MAG: phospholipase D family protein [Rhodothalassiaceae bacterium]